MHFDIDPPAIASLKAQATQLQEAARSQGKLLKRGQALEQIAHNRGFRDWNTAKAAAKASPTPSASGAPWRLTTAPLPRLPLRIHQTGDRTYASIRELMRWAGQLELISRLPQEERKDALGLIGGDVPYVFLNERGRWDDGLFHLCERSYDEMDGIVFSREHLEETGVVAWHKHCGVHPGDSFSIIHDEVRMSTDPTTLKQMARLLAAIAMKADELHGGYLLGPSSEST